MHEHIRISNLETNVKYPSSQIGMGVGMGVPFTCHNIANNSFTEQNYSTATITSVLSPSF